MSLADMPAVSIRWLSHTALTLIFKDLFLVLVLRIRKLSKCVLCDPRGIIRFAVHILHMIFINVKIYDYIMA